MGVYKGFSAAHLFPCLFYSAFRNAYEWLAVVAVECCLPPFLGKTLMTVNRFIRLRIERNLIFLAARSTDNVVFGPLDASRLHMGLVQT